MTPAAPDLIWTADGQLRSGRYDDIYFSSADGLAETRSVFLDGCDLPDAWAGRTRFVVGELGFGSGLNIAALLTLWRATRPLGGGLHIFSLEAHPLDADEAARALRPWPELAPAAQALTVRWPGRARGFHRVPLPQFHATLDVATLEVGEALAAWSGRADAWFLDGFSPARNPAMWRQEVLDLVAARSAPGARLATFSAAGAVRRGLQGAGFAVERHAGHGRKRHRLEARLPGAADVSASPPRVAIVGAGIGGAALARAFELLGVEAVVIDAVGHGGGASGNPAALVSPRLDAGLGREARLFAQAYAHALNAYDDTPGCVIGRGLLHLEQTARDAGRFAKIAASDLFEPGALVGVDAAQAAAHLGEAAAGGLWLPTAATVSPEAVLRAWAPRVSLGRVAALSRQAQGWRLADADGETLAVADIVCLAAGPATVDLAPGLPLSAIRGQAEWIEGAASGPAVTFGGYATPTREGTLFGATFDRGDTDVAPRAADRARNLAGLAAALPAFAARLDGRPLTSRAALRTATPDYLPLAGPLPGSPGLFVLSGLGSRGFATAPLLAEHVAALALDAPSPLPRDLGTLVGLERFEQRAARRRPPGGKAE